jgi:outer membrane lipoprotein carrier protein
VNQRRRAFSTLFGGALALSAVACAVPAQQAPKVAAVPRVAAPSAVPLATPAQPSLAAQPVLVAEPAPAAKPVPVAEPAPAAEPDGLTANEIVARVQAVYDKTNAVKLGFKQRYFAGLYDRQRDSTGSVIAVKSSQASWRYNNGNRVLVAGGLVQVYEKATRQLYLVPASKSLFPSALSFPFHQGKLEHDFKLTKQDARRMMFPSGYVVSCDSLNPSSAFKRVFFYIDGQTYLVRRVLLLDAQGNRSRFDFVKTELGVTVPPNEFDLQVPAGTQIIEYERYGRPD